MQPQLSQNMSRASFLSTQAAGRVNPAQFPVAHFLIWSTRTSLSDVTRRRIREAAQENLLSFPILTWSWSPLLLKKTAW